MLNVRSNANLMEDQRKLSSSRKQKDQLSLGFQHLQPDLEKVSALKKMTSPTNKQELQAFLALATYMGPFIPSLSTLTSPLRELIEERSVFDWHPAHQETFGKVKNAISAETTLGYYDLTKEIILQANAFTTGLGVTLLQDQKPITFASKTLTDTKSPYANIERDSLLWCMDASVSTLTSLFKVL